MGAYSQEAFIRLYRQRFKMVYQLCLVLLKNVPDAEDAAQTVFRRVLERSEPFRDPEHERAWLIVTARNECRDQLKHWWRTRRENGATLETLAWEGPQDGLIWEQVAALPGRHRLVLYLHYYQGYATGEIAALDWSLEIPLPRTDIGCVQQFDQTVGELYGPPSACGRSISPRSQCWLPWSGRARLPPACRLRREGENLRAGPLP